MDWILGILLWAFNMVALYFVVKMAIEDAKTANVLVQIRDELTAIREELKSRKES